MMQVTTKGLTQISTSRNANVDSPIVWNHPFNLELVYSDLSEGMANCISIELKVISIDSWGRKSVEGFCRKKVIPKKGNFYNFFLMKDFITFICKHGNHKKL
jgi:hypothetical protein